jgi:SAM-dependent methyltransferase
MQLLDDMLLEQSSIVANCRMNRERNLCGSNGYSRDLRLNPMDFLQDAVAENGAARWLDLCCGTGTALVEAGRLIDSKNLAVEVIGVDLVGLFISSSSKRVTLIQASLSDWQPTGTFDLITCVHGLHYIGDKLRLVSRARSWLTETGRFVANLDMANLKLPGRRSSSRLFASELRAAGFHYSFRQKLLQADGGRELALPFRYLGADDQAGPNYTGQPAVDSYYEPLNQP